MTPRAALAAACLLVASCGVSSESADLVLTGAKIYTLDPENATAESLAIADGRIVCVGAAAECSAFEGARTLDLSGKTIVPGLTDSHAHLSGIGFREMQLDLSEAESLADLQARLRDKAAETPPGEWIVGRGWIEARWDPPVFPRAQDLDAAAPDNPVWLDRADGHGAVANTRALEIADVDRSTAAPSGGEILLDADGEPTGMFLDRAKSLIEEHTPQETPDRIREALVLGARRYAERGWTGVSIAGISWDELEILRRLVDAGEIPVRVYAAVSGPGPSAERLLSDGIYLDDSLLTVRGVKLFIDGALGSRGAALLEPYSDAPDSDGLLIQPPEDLEPLLEAALREGLQIQTHAIGDRGNRLVLDLYERTFAAVPRNEWAIAEPRWRIEHAQIIDEADIPRFAELGVIASMQPSHAITDLHFAPSRLGPERLAGAYAWRTLLDAGARLAGGSDAPVEQGDPFIELYAATVRRDLDGFADENWHREQRLTREEALRLFTDWAAYARFEEDELGTLTVGKRADLTVLGGDFFEVDEARIPDLEATLTIVDGRIVYEQ